MTRKQKLAIVLDVVLVLFVALPAAGFSMGAETRTAATLGLLLTLVLTVALQVAVVRYCRVRRPSWPTSPKPTAPPAGY